jgi:hypothetical protein
MSVDIINSADLSKSFKELSLNENEDKKKNKK